MIGKTRIYGFVWDMGIKIWLQIVKSQKNK